MIPLLIVIIITQQPWILLTTSQILLQSTITLRINVSLATHQAQQHRKKDKRMRGCPQDERDPDAEVVDIKDLWNH